MSLQNPKRELLPEQAAAAYEIKKHISVTAGPGSGKTTVLVERYLHILREHNLSIDQIVAITFTNRAANEMRERLRERLNQILQTANDTERRRWLGYKRMLDGAVITTIHGFCARLLREFPVEARVDPQFLLLDEHRAAMLLESVVEQALTELISSGHVKISGLTLGVGRGKLAAALAQLYREVRGQGLTPGDLALKVARSHSTEDDHARALSELSHTMNDFLLVRRTTAAQRGNQSQVSFNWSTLEPFLHTIPEPDTLADYCRAVEGFRSLRPQARGDLAPHVKALDELVWEKDLLGRVPQICLDVFAKQYALEMVHLLTRIDERLNDEKQKLSALDFDDLELRALELLQRPEVLTRAAERYKFFLVDEFQDTNGVQRKLLERLTFQTGRRESANLFIVGDRKQSIYGFRGADVDVFSELTRTLKAEGGESRPLLLNFRSQPPLIAFFNYLFANLFQPKEQIAPRDLEELGYVEHEPSEARRELRDRGPLVELLITTEASGADDDPKAEQNSRELDAQQLAQRIIALVDPGSAGVPPASSDGVTQVQGETIDSVKVAVFVEGRRDACGPRDSAPKYSDIALLFRAMTNVQTYESAFRRANIPYQTVLGRGFYEREEITDLIQLLRFLDNKTDELALAAVLRSPLGGISDNALLALRCAPWLDEIDTSDPLKHFSQTRRLFQALSRHREIAFITDPEHKLLEQAADLIKGLIARRHHYALGDLLRFAVEQSEFMTVIAATFDGAQRLANVQRLFTLAERFERSGTHLIRDFVRYVEEFEAIGSRESEGQIDEAANAVRLMTIHQAKGLEFPIVIIPELQRYSKVMDNWFLLDRHRGLTLKVPDGRGKLVAGCTFNSFEQRNAWREQFESMRLLYVAATRAEDRLILSGTTKTLESLSSKSDTWLKWIWQSLGLETQTHSGTIDLTDQLQLQLTLNLSDQPGQARAPEDARSEQIAENAVSLIEAFPLLRAIEPELDRRFNRFSVTQLINYQRCPRQYYFDRILNVAAPDEMAVWNNAEAPEPPANLTATLKGAVIHRFCEKYSEGDDLEARLRRSLEDVIRSRQAQLADRLEDINLDVAIKELLPLAKNYLRSKVFERVQAAAKFSGESPARVPLDQAGLWSELSFRLRRPLGILTGTIDKLLVSRSQDGNGFEIEIIDFKTNRMSKPQAQQTGAMATEPAAAAASTAAVAAVRRKRARSQYAAPEQFALDFSTTDPSARVERLASYYSAQSAPSLEDQVRLAASDYELQMQAYALAVRELMPNLGKETRIKVTLHFLDPEYEYHLEERLLATDLCAQSIDDAILQLISSHQPEQFPVRPAPHCRMCNFLNICSAGRQWVAENTSR